MFYQYCNKWKLFNGNARDYKHNFKMEQNTLENVKEYKYLGITFTNINNFRITKNNLKVLSTSKDKYISTECKL